MLHRRPAASVYYRPRRSGRRRRRDAQQHALRNFAALLLWPAKLALVAAWVLFVVLYVASRFIGETLAREGVVASVVFILTWTPTVVFRALYLAVWAPAISYFHIPAWAIIALLTPGATAACVDTRGWKQKWGKGCDTYENDGHCANGAVVEGHAWSVGADFNFPEQHCCACGKKAAEHCDETRGRTCSENRAPTTAPSTSAPVAASSPARSGRAAPTLATRRPTAASAASRPRRRRRRRRGRRRRGERTARRRRGRRCRRRWSATTTARSPATASARTAARAQGASCVRDRLH